KRLELIVRQPTATDIQGFLQRTVLPAMQEVAQELQRKGVAATVIDETDSTRAMDEVSARLVIPMPELRDFVYGVRPVKRRMPGFMLTEVADEAPDVRRHVVEPITFFADGREGYDVQYL